MESLFCCSKKKIALIGDSTVTDRSGWGKAFANQFNENVEVKNFAVSGRSSKNFLNEGHFKPAIEFKPDFLLIQFGHNGQKEKGPNRETDPTTTYRDFLKIYIEKARSIGTIPVLVSPLVRRDFDPNGRIWRKLQPGEKVSKKRRTKSLQDRADACAIVAKEMNVTYIDLHTASRNLHDQLGPKASMLFNPKENDITHLNAKGAKAISKLVVLELTRVEKELAQYLKEVK